MVVGLKICSKTKKKHPIRWHARFMPMAKITGIAAIQPKHPWQL
jgi:hypothetical protein